MNNYYKITYRFASIVLLLSMFAIPNINASHIVGGEMRYECVGDDLYKLFLSLRRDCFNGAPDAQFDKFAYLGIFDENGFPLQNLGQNGVITMKFNPDDTLNEILTSECEVLGENVCVHTTTYSEIVDRRNSGVIKLPFRKGGYIISYQRCCRNNTLTNIIDPLETGSTYFVKITEDALRGCNEAARFKQWASIYLCAGDTIGYDHSAFDADGDSLVYRLCTPYHGASFDEPKKEPADPPPYELIRWKQPFGLNNMFGGNRLTIDEKTGLMVGVPTETGQYLIGICVEEYRNGELINITRRDFEYNVRICPINPIASFDHDSVICEGLTVDFANSSSDGNYNWYFDADNDRTITSIDRNPTHTYDKPGFYTIVLVAIRDSICIDSFSSRIYVYGDDRFGADFDYRITDCEDEVTLELFDLSFDSLNTVLNDDIVWKLKGKNGVITKRGKNISVTYTQSDTLEVTLIFTTQNGCVDSLTKTIPVNILDIDFKAGEIPICSGESTKLVNNFNPNLTYTWTPSNTLSCSICPNPTASPTKTTVYTVTVSDGNCEVEKMVTVKVNKELDIDVIGDSIACDSLIVLRTAGGVEASVVWASDRDFINILGSGSFELVLRISSADTTIYVKGETENGCEGMDSLHIFNEIIDVEYVDEYHICVGDTIILDVINKRPLHNLGYKWTPSQFIIANATTNHPSLKFDMSGSFLIKFEVINEYNCLEYGEITITVEDLPKVDFEFTHSCENLDVMFKNLSDGGRYIWGFGDGDTSHAVDPFHTYKKSGTYIVTLNVEEFCINEISRSIHIGFIDAQPDDTIISCGGREVELYPGADGTLNYSWSPGKFLDDSTKANPKAKVDTSTTFTVRITDPDIMDCYVDRTIFVMVPQVLVYDLSKDTILCYSDSLLLLIKSQLDLNYEWRNQKGILIGSGDSIWVKVEEEETFTVVIVDEFGCTKTDQVKVSPYIIDIEIEAPDLLCHGFEATITINNLGEGKLSYEWSPIETIVKGQGTNQIKVNPKVTTKYSVKITSEDGCEYRREVTINVSKVNPRPIIIAGEDTIYFKHSTQLMLNEDYETYLWIPEDGLSCTECPDPIASPNQTTTYKVYVTNEEGCLDSAFYRIVVILPECNEDDVFVPNIFSPNNDGENDVWQVRSNFIERMEVIVYNRWGQEVYSSMDLNAAWDGSFNGEYLANDVYAYRIYVKCVDGQDYITKGNVTISR